MKYFIEVKNVADSPGIILKKGKPLGFWSEDQARRWGRENIKGKYIAWWQPMSKEEAEKRYKLKTS